jgi:radical SAM/Cys-rich protein
MVAMFKERMQEINPTYCKFDALQTLQLNLGNLCNLSCNHCHVGASPRGKQVMEREVMEKVVNFLQLQQGVTLDITGGCPEMNPHFRFLIETTAGLSERRMVRSNLAICSEPGMEWLPEFYRQQRLVLIGSLPCYLEENVDRQRGNGVYRRSIDALKRLNSLGYGTELELNLVYNPGGDFIAGAQKELEEAYKHELQHRHGIRFNSLYTITNAPIGRFREQLEARGAYERYLHTLATHFNPAAAAGIMCRTLVSVDWQGVLYNCDFNQAVGLPIVNADGEVLQIGDLAEAAKHGKELVLDQHCYCCTSGEGSSCTGALAA